MTVGAESAYDWFRARFPYTELHLDLSKVADGVGCMCVQVQVSGNYPGNTANILSNNTVCNSVVYVVDRVGAAAIGAQ